MARPLEDREEPDPMAWKALIPQLQSYLNTLPATGTLRYNPVAELQVDGNVEDRRLASQGGFGRLLENLQDPLDPAPNTQAITGLQQLMNLFTESRRGRQ